MAFLSSQRNIIDVLESTRIFNAIEIMCLRQAQAPRWEVRTCLLQAQAPCNEIIGDWACRSHCVWIFCICFNITKFTEILRNDGVFEFSKEHQRCSIECTDFNAIEIMCLRQAQAPRWEVRMCLRQAQAPRWELRMCLLQAQAACNKRFGGWACRSHYVWNICVYFNNTKFTEIL